MSGSAEDNFADTIIKAKNEGFEVIQGDPLHLLLDLDTDDAIDQYERVKGVVEREHGAVTVGEWFSKSGNTHVVMLLPKPMDVPSRLALQAALGSDGVREALGLKRFMSGIDEPSLLFRPAPKKIDDSDDIVF